MRRHTLDSQQDVCTTYRKAAANLAELRGSANVRVVHGVDATQLVSTLKPARNTKVRTSYDCVVWNFPYPMGEGRIPGDVCGELMRGFFRSVSSVLEDGGQVRVTLAMRQGGTTKELQSQRGWRIEDVAENEGFDLIEVLPFKASVYDGYEPRRAGPRN